LRLDAAQLRDVGLALLDVDDFKSVNDEHGHAAGDALLVALAELLRATARTWGARAYRLGGDEFVILGTGPLDAGQLRAVQALFRHSAARAGLKVQSFSYSPARAPRDGQNLCALLEHADAQLLRQKVERRGMMTAQLMQHLQQSAAETLSPGHTPRPEIQPFQTSWPAPPPSWPLRPENG
jgi:diguanylate cyclase (GGDEF)-like protein